MSEATETAEIINFTLVKEEPKCSFCKRPESKVPRLLDNGQALKEHRRHICRDCIVRCAELLTK